MRPWERLADVQFAFELLLIGVLSAAVVFFAVMGLLQTRRKNVLTRKAHEGGMRFSGRDPFNIPCRYRRFALIDSGHSPHATNVTYGRRGGGSVRAFDFRCEAGHGTRRVTRHYDVVVVETDFEIPGVLLWDDRDAEHAPLAARQADGHMAWWSWRGSEGMAARMIRACGASECSCMNLQVCGNVLLLCAPGGASSRASGALMDMADSVVESLSRSRVVRDAEAPGDELRNPGY